MKNDIIEIPSVGIAIVRNIQQFVNNFVMQSGDFLEDPDAYILCNSYVKNIIFTYYTSDIKHIILHKLRIKPDLKSDNIQLVKIDFDAEKIELISQYSD